MENILNVGQYESVQSIGLDQPHISQRIPVNGNNPFADYGIHIQGGYQGGIIRFGNQGDGFGGSHLLGQNAGKQVFLLIIRNRRKHVRLFYPFPVQQG